MSSIVSAATERYEPIELQVSTRSYVIDANSVHVQGYESDNIPGAPALPVWRTLVELPTDANWQIRFSSTGSQTIAPVSTITATPVQEVPTDYLRRNATAGDLTDIVHAADRPDPTIYQRDELYPSEPIVTGSEQWQRGRRLLALRVYPIQYNPVRGELLYHPDLTITIDLQPAQATVKSVSAVIAESDVTLNPPAGSNALLIRTGPAGLYRLTYNDFLAAGWAPEGIDPAGLALTYLGQSVALDIWDNGDNQFDPDELVVFYAEPYKGRYGKDNIYWLTQSEAAPARVVTRTVTPGDYSPIVTTITRTLHIENNRVYQSTYPRPQNTDHWFDNALSVDELGATTATRAYDLALTDVITTGRAVLTLAVHGGLDRAPNPDNSLAVSLNNRHVITTTWEGVSDHIIAESVPAAWLDGMPNRVTLKAGIAQLPGIDFYTVSPDWLQIAYPARASATNDRLTIEAMADGAYELQASGFSTSTVLAYDVRDPQYPVRLLTTAATSVNDSYTISLWDAELPNPTYELSSIAALRAPLGVTSNAPSSWRTPNHAYDYIAVIHPTLATAIQPLLGHRMAEGWRVAAVDVQDIYDEFSFGLRDPRAIRDFLTYAYFNWNSGAEPPRFVLLVGDGHYDFTGVSGTTLPNLIPPYLVNVDPWIGETAADNRYVSVDGPDDHLPDMAIGRIPANTPADVSAYVDKVLAYETAAPAGDWQQQVAFVADNNNDPAGNFHALNEDVRLNWLPTYYSGEQIYYNGNYFTGSDHRNAVKAAFNNDVFMLQWFGHASRFFWGTQVAFTYADPASLAANDTWPITMAYSCWAGYFINLAYNFQTVGEYLIITPQRGSVGDLSPAGKHIGDALQILNRGVVKSVFQDRNERFGEAVSAARLYYHANSSAFKDVIDTTILFGDPALKLRLPDVPLDVALADSAATQQNNTIVVDWQTAHEVGVAGFNVWRSTSPDAPQTQLNTNLIPSQASPAPGPSSFAYQFSDSDSFTHAADYYYWVEALGVTDGLNTLFGPYTVTYQAPLSVTLLTLTAAQQGNTVVVDWQTDVESGNAGFNIWRGSTPDAPETQLNAELIPSQAGGRAADYQYIDQDGLLAGSDYYYWIEAVGVVAGNRAQFGPVLAQYGVPTAVILHGASTNPLVPLVPWTVIVVGIILTLVARRRCRANRSGDAHMIRDLREPAGLNRPRRIL